MADQMEFDQSKDHVGGNFEWDVAPNCCTLLKAAVDDDKFIFVSNFASEGNNSFYMMPVTSEGYFARDNGVAISHCPWCGTKIVGRKKYTAKST
ncbi:MULTISPECIES: hypothetical protein [unclassified Mesorhizobium]|uniref:hypothetical protein n=1 Tax=unclassified Mesorhizobium TaxID=325217 RepID=UPI000F74E8D1|nr:MULTISPECIES: hypothetical protein [unclassified Mesorhizobium]AZO54893.1 hypothetical protein EJ077_16635 [Mesorhizobium sp. M8A.F.Ca.ET.057.01.1.1]RWE41728.1 MAG: hypothetical protein EOS80_27425 [Mesorhizobium sp.]